TTPDLAGLFENVGKQRWFSIGLTDESIKAGQGAGTSGAGIVNVAPADQTEEVRAAALLEGVWGSVVGAQKEKQKEWLPNTAQEDMSLKAAAYGVANMLGTSDDESYKEIVGALRAGYQGKNAEDTWRKFYDKLLAGKSTAAQLLAQSPEVAKFIPRPVSQVGGDDLAYGWNNYTLADEPQEPAETPLVGGKRQTQIALERVNRQAMADPWQYWEDDREAVRGASLGGLLMGRPNLQDAGFHSQQDIANNMFNRGRGPSTSYGVLAPEVEAAANLQGSEAYKSITKALTTLEPGWDRKAEYDLQQFALGQSGGDFAKADVELQKLAAVIGDTNSEFYQLIQGARGLGDTFQGIELSSASSMQVASALVQRAELSRENWEKNPEAPDSFPAMMADMQAVQQQRDAMRGRNMAIVVGKRELDIGLSRGREDFDRSMGFREEDFYLQRDRAERDRNIQLERMDTHRNIQLARTWRDYNIQRERSEYEFNLQRRRGYQSYCRQLQRTWRDYNNQRERSQYEFNLSRERQEEDFNHQLEVMAKRSAQSIY